MSQPRSVPQGSDAYATLVVLAAPGGTLGVGNASISTGEVLLRAASNKRRSIIIQNHSANKIAVGPTGVTTLNSPTIDANGDLTLDKGAGAAIYCVADGASSDVRWIEENND